MYAKYFQGHHLVQLTNRCTNPLIIIVNLPLNSFHIMSRPVQFQGALIITLSYHFLLSVVDLFLSSPHILSSIYSNWASLLPNSMFSTLFLSYLISEKHLTQLITLSLKLFPLLPSWLVYPLTFLLTHWLIHLSLLFCLASPLPLSSL